MRLRTRILSERFFTEEQGRTVEVVSEGLNEGVDVLDEDFTKKKRCQQKFSR